MGLRKSEKIAIRVLEIQILVYSTVWFAILHFTNVNSSVSPTAGAKASQLTQNPITVIGISTCESNLSLS